LRRGVPEGEVGASGERREEILQHLVELVDAGLPLDAGALRAAFPGCEEDVRRALAGLEGYLEARRLLAASETLHPFLVPGEKLADFEIVSAVGRGGMGEIYLARELTLGGRPVALKILRPALAGTTNRRRFEREGRLLSRLRHPSLAEVYRCGEERGIPYLVMRFVRGRSLRDWLTAFKAEPPEDLERIAAKWTAQVAEALAHVHESGLVHRDVKPANIIVEDQGRADPRRDRAVLVDFGLVRAVDSLATTAPSPATLSYAPPEQILGRTIDARADVFSLGATLHDLLSLRLPGERERAAVGLEPLDELRPAVDRQLAAIVAQAVDPDPRWRYRDGAALCADLERWCQGRPVSAHGARPWERLRRAVARRPRAVVRWGGLALLLAALALAVAQLRVASVHAAELRAAGDEGDLRALARAAGAIAGWTRPLLRDSGVEETLARLDRPGDSLAEAVRLDGEGASPQALRAAAIGARIHGAGDCAPLRAYLVRALEEASPLRRDALRLVARVFYERPDETPEDSSASAPLRRALSGLPERAPSAEERFLAVTALSGCGVAAEAEALLDWALEGAETLENPETCERLRLGLCSVERILFRSLACGLPDREQLERIERKVTPFVQALIDGRAERGVPWNEGFGVANATWMLSRSLALVRRALPGGAGDPSALESLLERAFHAQRLPAGEVIGVLSAQRSAAIRPLLLRAGFDGLPGRDALASGERLGFYCALGDDLAGLGALALLASVDALVRGTMEPLKSLKRGVREGIAFRHGWIPESDRPDADTRLGATLDSFSGELETRSGGSGGWLAAWDFTGPVAVVLDGARGASVGECRVTGTDDGAHQFLKFSSFGSSWVELRFHGGESRACPVLLELEHVIGARPHCAYAGVVVLDVFLDGMYLDSVRLEMNRTVPYELRIDESLLTPAEHDIAIRSNPATTTTYRLHRVRLRRL
jgi:hypothetical protein